MGWSKVMIIALQRLCEKYRTKCLEMLIYFYLSNLKYVSSTQWLSEINTKFISINWYAIITRFSIRPSAIPLWNGSLLTSFIFFSKICIINFHFFPQFYNYMYTNPLYCYPTSKWQYRFYIWTIIYVFVTSALH